MLLYFISTHYSNLMARFIPFLYAFVLVSGLLKAQQKDSTAFQKDLEEVTVTSSRLNLKPSQIPQKINVISSRDIEMTPSMDLADVVKKMASIDVIQYPQVSSYINIRGFRPAAFSGSINPETSILINGRQSGTINLSLIDPNNIERIEVLKGAAGAIYGSSAMGGVVNIITKHSMGKVSGKVYGGYGSFSTTDFGLNVGGNITERLDFDFSATLYSRNDNFKFGKGNVFRKLLKGNQVTLFKADGSEIVETDEVLDGQERANTRIGYNSGTFRLGYQLGKNWRVDFNANKFVAKGIETAGDWHNGDAQRGLADRSFETGELTLKGNAGKHDLMLKGFVSQEYADTYRLTTGPNDKALPTPTFRSSNQDIGWKGAQFQDAILVNNNVRFIVGADYIEAYSYTNNFVQGTVGGVANVVSPTRPSTPRSAVRTVAPFAQAHVFLLNRRLILNPGFRYDFIHYEIQETPFFTGLTLRSENNAFPSPSLGLQYSFTKAITLHGTVGRAFRFPRALEIAGYSEEYLTGKKVRITEGNAALKNEQSVTWDVGLRFAEPQKGLRFDVTYFQTALTNRVRQVEILAKKGQPSPPDLTIDRYLTYVNADESNISGLEYEGAIDLCRLTGKKSSFNIFANATSFIKYEDVTKGDAGTPDNVATIRNIAKTTFGYGLEFDNRKNFSARLSGRYVGTRLDNDFGNLDVAKRGLLIEYSPYMTLDFVATANVASQHAFSVRINNLTDENYYEKRGFNMPGRNTTLRYTFRF